MDEPAANPPRLLPHRSALMLIDLQERLVPVMKDREQLVRRAARLVQGANLLGIPQLVTEQYPRGLGGTVDPVARHIVPRCIEEKTRFSAFIHPIRDRLRELEVDTVLVAGVEAHVCVQATCLDLVQAGYRVFAAWDAISSRRTEDKRAARERLTLAGVVPTTVESALLEWLADASDGRFRQIQRLIRGESPG